MMALSARKYMLSNAKTNLIRMGASILANLVLTPFIIRGIGLDNYSYVALTSFFISFSSFFDLGLSKSLVFLLNGSETDIRQKNQFLTAQVLVVGGIVLLVFGVGLFALLTGTSVLGKSLPATDPYFIVVTLVSFLVLMLTVFDQFLCSVLESFFLLHHVNHGMTVKILILNVLYLVNLLVWNSLSFYVWASVFAILAATVYYLVVLQKHVCWQFCWPTRNIMKILIKHSYHFFRFSMLNSLYSALPRLSVMYISSDLSYIGILDVVEKISMSVINLCSSILRPIYSLSRQNPYKVARQLSKVMMLNGAVGLAFVLFMVVFNRFIISYFFRQTAMDASFIGQILIIYAFGSFFLLLGQPLSFYLQGEGRTNRMSMFFGVNVVLFLLLYVGMKEMFQMNALLNLSVCYLSISIIYFVNLFVFAKTIRRVRLLGYGWKIY